MQPAEPDPLAGIGAGAAGHRDGQDGDTGHDQGQATGHQAAGHAHRHQYRYEQAGVGEADRDRQQHGEPDDQQRVAQRQVCGGSADEQAFEEPADPRQAPGPPTASRDNAPHHHNSSY
jgi:hypothetical protein